MIAPNTLCSASTRYIRRIIITYCASCTHISVIYVIFCYTFNFSLLHILGTCLSFTHIPWKTDQMPFLCTILSEEVDPCVYMAPSDIFEHDSNNFLFKHTKINYNNMIVCISVSLRIYSEYYSMFARTHVYMCMYVRIRVYERVCVRIEK